MVIREIGWACQHAARDDADGMSDELLIVAGDLLKRFLHEQTNGGQK